MGSEIERKFLLRDDTWRYLARGVRYRQGYLNSNKERTVRVRTIKDRGYLTIKGPNKGATRVEYEYDIPESDATAMLNDLCEKPLITLNGSAFIRQSGRWIPTGMPVVLCEGG